MIKPQFIILIFVLGATRLTAQIKNNPDQSVVNNLKKFRQEYVHAWLNNEPESINVYYSDRIRIMPELQKSLIGKSDADAYNRAFLQRFEVKIYTRNEIEILDLGPQIMEIGKLTMTLTLKSSGKSFELIGTYLNLWEVLPDHTLLIITEAWNYDHYYEEIHNHLKFEEVHGVHLAFLPNVNITDNISFELSAYNRLLDATVTAHEANTWAQFYAEDAMLIPNYHDIYNGKKEIREYMEMHVQELPIFEALDIRNDRIDNLGEFVIEYASHIASWRNGSSSGVSLGKNLRVWRRDKDHSLKLFRSIAMYD